MMISVRHHFAFLAMTKAASTAIESAIADRCEIVVSGDPRLKHMSYRRYARFFEKFLGSYGIEDVETIAVIRHPVEWLHSWYRYRSRPRVAPDKSTATLSFDDFALAWMEPRQPEFARVGRPFDFVRDKAGKVGVQTLYKFENLIQLEHDLSERLDEPVSFTRKNVSPEDELVLSPSVRQALETALDIDFRIHAGAK